MPEIKLELDTGNKGQVNHKTKILKGKLNCIIVNILEEKKELPNNEALNAFFRGWSINPKIDMVIQSSLGYLILHRNQIDGITYFAPRTIIAPSEGDIRDILTFDKFKLNEPLLITIMGPKNTKVDMIIRLD